MPTFELLGKHGPDALVAFGEAGTKTARDLLEDAARIAAALPAPYEGSQALLVFERDRYAMAAALLGALDRGHAVALPPNARRDSVFALNARPETATVLHDTDAGMPIGVVDLIDGGSKTGQSEAALASPYVPPAGVIATVFTSGTTGPMTAWPKTSAELLGEASALGQAFDVGPGDRILGTVPPGHIYGLLFTILLPLLRGAAFSRETPHHAEAIAHTLAQHRANILVTVPAQLRALGALGANSLSGLRRVFSSTGPLPDPVAKAFYDRHEIGITEILGSTETGGIASRMRDAGELAGWRPFDEVRVSIGEAGELGVDSPFVQSDLPRPFETADLVEMNADGTFTHLGRSDGIVKIGGRRVSIQEVEDCIRQQPGIEDASVVAVPADGARGNQLLAAIVPASYDVAEVKKALRKKFEPTCLPRRFACVEELPRETNGKLSRDRMLRLFGLQADGRPVNWALAWGEPSVQSDDSRERFEISVRVPEDYAWFEGHFEAYAVLAGAAQLKDLIFPVVERAFPDLGAVVAMRRIKFSGRIRPGDDLTISVERGSKRSRVEFEIRKSSEVCSRGTLTHAERETP
jgi:acyl-coenzyme A synthetase/AMP-(fatty) acid ligase/3-hydroxymyristoyl/3-hydroxydecanoyl-(acyl carrier protein) dehydratase